MAYLRPKMMTRSKQGQRLRPWTQPKAGGLWKPLIKEFKGPSGLLRVQGGVANWNGHGGRALRKVMLPSALPSIVVGLRLAVIYAGLGTIGAEFLMSLSTGIGSFMMEGASISAPISWWWASWSSGWWALA
jgi:hypothetical protein